MKPAVLFAVLFAFLWSASAQTVYPDYQDGVIIFQLKTDKSVSIIPSVDGQVNISSNVILSRLHAKYNSITVSQLYPNHDYDILERTYQINFADPSTVDQMIKDLSSFSEVEYAERKELHQSFLTPNDAYYTNSFSNGQWALF